MSDAGVVDGVRAVSSGASSSVRPIFGLETLERSAAGSRGGFITSCSAASACVLVGTTAGSCVLYDFAAGSRREVDCAAASPASRAAVSRVWLAPDARHALVLLRDADDDRLLGLAHFSCAAPHDRARLVKRAKGIDVTAVGWVDAAGSDEAEAILGDAGGSLHVLRLDGDPEARAPESRFDAKALDARGFAPGASRAEPVAGVVPLTASAKRAFARSLLVATPTRLFALPLAEVQGHHLPRPGSVAAALKALARGSPLAALVEMPGVPGAELARSELTAFASDSSSSPPVLDRFAWLVALGSYRGVLDADAASSLATAASALDAHSLAPFPSSETAPGCPGYCPGAPDSIPPLAAAATTHHALALFPTHVGAVNVVTGDVSGALPVRPEGLPSTSFLDGEPVALATDASDGTIFLVTDASLAEVTVRDEARDMWLRRAERREFDLAFALCGDDEAKKDRVRVLRAEAAERDGDALEAARRFAEAGDGIDLDAACRRFLDREETEALAEYLDARLDNRRAPLDDTAARRVAAWLLDLRVAAARERGEGGADGGAEAKEGRVAAVRATLKRRAPLLDAEKTRTLLSERDRADDLEFFDECVRNFDAVLARRLRGDGRDARLAVSSLARAETPAEAVEDAAAELFRLDPTVATDFFVSQAAAGKINPERLARELEAEVFASGDDSEKDPTRENTKRAEATRYLRRAVETEGVASRGAHDVFLRLLLANASAEKDSAGDRWSEVLEYLATSGLGPSGAPRYDPEVAARRCVDAGAPSRAAALIACAAGDGDAAVEAALREGDLETAKEVARRGGAFGEPSGRRALNDGGSFSRNALSSLIDGVSDESEEDEAADAGDATRRATKRRMWRSIARHVVERGFEMRATDADVDAEMEDQARRFRERAETAASIEREISGESPGEPAARDSSANETLSSPSPETLRELATAAAVSRAASASPLARDETKRASVFRETLALARESDGAVTVEDLLGFLPDFTLVDDVKDAVLEELDRYAARVEKSRREIEESKRIAERAEGEAEAIAARTLKLRWDAPCAGCGGLISSPPAAFARFAALGKDPERVAESSPLAQFYAFPCGMAFHASCLIEHALPWMEPETRKRCLDLANVVRPPLTREAKAVCKQWARAEREAKRDKRREREGTREDPEEGDENPERARGEGGDRAEPSAAPETKREGTAGKKPPVDRARAIEELEDLLCEECPFCGEMTLRMMHTPLVGSDEEDEIESWRMLP